MKVGPVVYSALSIRIQPCIRKDVQSERMLFYEGAMTSVTTGSGVL